MDQHDYPIAISEQQSVSDSEIGIHHRSNVKLYMNQMYGTKPECNQSEDCDEMP